MTIGVRLATMADYEAVCVVVDEGDAHHREALPHIFKKPEGPVRSVEHIGGMIEREDSALFVALLAEEVVGVLEIHDRALPEAPLFVPGRYALVDNVAVKASARGAGVGQALIADPGSDTLGGSSGRSGGAGRP